MKLLSATFLFVALCYAFSACKKDNPPVEPATNQTVFMADFDGGLYAFNAQTGVKLWEKRNKDFVSDGFIVAGKLLYVPTYEHSIQAYDVATGELKWEVTFEKAAPFIHNVVVTNGILVTNGTDYLVGIDATSGQKKWENTSGSGSNLYARAGVIYMHYGSEAIAVNATNGSIQWRSGRVDNLKVPFAFDTENLYAYGETPERNSTSFPGDFRIAQFIHTIDLTTGKVKKSHHLPDLIRPRLHASSPEHLYLRHDTESGYHISSLAKSSGIVGWTIAEKGGMAWSSPFYSNSFLYLGNEQGSFFQMNEITGVFKEVFRVSQEIRSSPVVANGMIYVGSGGVNRTTGELHAIEESTGQVKWSVPIQGNVAIASPAVLDSKGKAYHYAESGMLN